ncbi:MAG: hydantoinase/oxoprolinase family protein [Betaproteobacteria bacterium]|nr:hydantoinase/oxoprolinase family protein [Betaproteobacteria bacterium]
MAPSPGLRVAVDIGGTFTDVVLQRGPQIYTSKLLTTPHAPEQAMIDGILQVLAQGRAEPEDLDLLVHGTTLATNALIERKGAVTGLITNEGFRDVLAMGDEKRFDHYDLDLEKPLPLVPRQLRIGVRGRMLADGREYEALSMSDVDRALDSMKLQGVTALAVGLLHAYANPAHELVIAQRARAQWPDLTVSLSSQVCPEIREYERLSTTVANAYVQPLMSSYLRALQKRLHALGFRCPLFMVTSSGGLTTLETAAEFPIRLVESGPAGGASLSAFLSLELGLEHALSFDMGGTTAKICFIHKGQAQQSRKFEVARSWKNRKGSGWPVRIPVTEMVEIGAGGGSIGRLDLLGRICMGPDSAGAAPGPACYSRGGDKPTVTDAQLLLGRLDPLRFAGGTFKLDRQAADHCLDKEIARPQLLDTAWGASGMLEIVDENMANAARVHGIERGQPIGQCTLIAFGGAAPLHAASMARRLDIDHIVIPKNAGVGSALGFLLSPLAFELVRSLYVDETRPDFGQVNTLLEDLQTSAQEVVQAGAPKAPLRTRCWVDVRYQGQGHELTIELPQPMMDRAGLSALRQDFERRYRAQYGLLIEGVPLEFLNWTVSVAAPAWTRPQAAAAMGRLTPGATEGHASVFDPLSGRWIDHLVYAREQQTGGSYFEGPALVVEDQTTTLVPAGWQAQVDSRGHLHLRAATARAEAA